MNNLNPPVIEFDYFIAHASPSAPKASELFELLTGEHRVFLDRVSLAPGANWPRDLSSAQATSLVTVALICRDYHSAYYAQEEVAAGIAYERTWGEGRHKVIPVYLDGFPQDPIQIPYGLRCKNALVVHEPGGLKEVAKQLIALLPPQPIPMPNVHPLKKYPTGPMVQPHVVSTALIQEYARLIRQYEALQVIAEANAFRLEADPNDPKTTIIKEYQLVPAYTVAPYAFWLDAFKEARLHGPRMLAALLMVVPDDQFDPKARENRRQLLGNLLMS